MKRILIIMLFVAVSVSCARNANNKSQQTIQSVTAQESLEKGVVQVLYFHGKKRCATCNAIEKLTREVVDSLSDKNIVINVLDISDKANSQIAEKYEVSWSALILDCNGRTINLTEAGFAHARTNPDLFKSELIQAIKDIGK